MKVAMLTGGGDVPGLNPALKALATGALAAGWEATGIRNGWQGLLACNPDDPHSRARWLRPLDAEAVRTIDRDGGTFLHSARTHPGAVAAAALPAHLQGSPRARPRPEAPGTFDCTDHVLHVLAALGIDAIFPIGGDDTLGYGARLHREGVAVIGLPKTMDNDVAGTDYCLGFATCVSRSVAYLHQLRTCTGSHERLAVVEVMGRNAGATSLLPAYLASVDRAIIAEVPFAVDRLADLLMADRRANPSGYAMVTVSEGSTPVGGQVLERGAADAFGHRKLGGIGQALGEALGRRTGVGIVYQNLGYLVRSGPPDALDVMVAFNYGALAIELARARTFGRLVCLRDGVYGDVPLDVVAGGARRLDVDLLYDRDAYRPRPRSIAGLPMFLR